MTEQGSTKQDDIDRIDGLFDKLFIAPLNDDECQQIWSAAVADKDLMRRYVEIVHLREGLPYLLSQLGPTGFEPHRASADGSRELQEVRNRRPGRNSWSFQNISIELASHT